MKHRLCIVFILAFCSVFTYGYSKVSFSNNSVEIPDEIVGDNSVEHIVFEKKVDSLFVNIIWTADFEPSSDDAEYLEFIKWSKKYLLHYYDIDVDTSGIDDWDGIIEYNAKCVEDLLNSDQAKWCEENKLELITRRVVMSRAKGTSYTNYYIMIDTDGSSYGMHGEHGYYIASFNKTTGERFSWNSISDVDGLLAHIDKDYIGGYMEDSESWINTDSLVSLMRNHKPISDPYIVERQEEKYLCLFYRSMELNPGYNLPFPYEVALPLNQVFSFLNDKGKNFL